MNGKTFTSQQIEELRKNKNVARCSNQRVRYSRDFKAAAVKRYREGRLTAVEIFEAAGFDLAVIGKRRPNKLMYQWRKALWAKNGDGSVFTGGVDKKIRSGNGIGMLKARIAYLEAENDFLAKMRAGKRQ